MPGAKRYRNPDEDLPQDFETKREEYYQALQQPLEVEAFMAQIQGDMTQALEQLNRGLPKNSKVKSLDKRGGWIQLTPLEKQAEPEYLSKLKEEIKHRWSIISPAGCSEGNGVSAPLHNPFPQHSQSGDPRVR